MIAPGFLARRIERFDAAPPPSLVEQWPPADLVRTAVIGDFDVEPAALAIAANAFSGSEDLAVNGYSTNGIGSLSVAGGQATITSGGTTIMHTDVRWGADLDMPQCFVSIDILARGSAGSFVYDHARLGISAGSLNWWGVDWDPTNGRLIMEQTQAGSYDQTYVSASLSAPFRLGMSLVGNSLCVWTDTGSGWTFRGGRSVSFDPRGTSLTGFKPYFGAAKNGSGTSSFTFDNLRIGRFGAVGVRDCAFITNENGSLRDFGGKIRFTATCADPRGGGNAGLWELDPVAETVRQVGVLMMGRDGGIWNDLGPHLARLSDGTWQHISATWGNNPFAGGALGLRRGVTATDITSGSHVLTGSAITPPSIPSPNGSAYDAMAVLIGGEWRVAYAIVDPRTFAGGNFYPALAKTSDWSSWTLIDDDPTQPLNEGMKIVIANGAPYVVTGGRGEQLIYDETMTLIASALDVDEPLYNGPDTQPWANLGAWGDEWLLLTFDNTRYAGGDFTWGRLLLYRAPRYV